MSVQQNQSAFLNAMDTAVKVPSDKMLGENNSPEYTAAGVKESIVALFFALVRDIPMTRLDDLIKDVMREAKRNPDRIADLFIMAFQTRNCRGGKGERNIFHRMIIKLHSIYPDTVEELLALAPEYGSYKDWFQIYDLAENQSLDQKSRIQRVVLDLCSEQLMKDQKALDTEGGDNMKVSLLAKWIPRESSQYKKQASALAKHTFPNSQAPKKDYRKLVARLSKVLKCPEQMMSAKRFGDIDFSHVPSLSMMKHRKAFLNEKLKSTPGPDEEETGNRHPDVKDRVKCRKRLREAILDTKVKKIKGQQLYPHQIVKKFMNDGWSYRAAELSSLEKDLLYCQWDDIRSGVLEVMKKVKEEKSEDEAIEKIVDLGNIVPLVDVSGSMSGTPMEVAIALGILVSEITSPSYANRCLTFSERPEWVEIDPSMPLEEKVHLVQSAPWGMSTNFEQACEHILKVAVEAKLQPEDIPDLIVFSDMQFDEASNQNGAWETHQERIVRRFKEEGLKVSGKAWPAPHIIYWNLRGNTRGFPAQADTENVTMLSGYSPSLMKLLLDGESLGEEETWIDENGDEIVMATKKDPYSTVRKALDNEEYESVRKVLKDSREGDLEFYGEFVNVM